MLFIWDTREYSTQDEKPVVKKAEESPARLYFGWLYSYLGYKGIGYLRRKPVVRMYGRFIAENHLEQCLARLTIWISSLVLYGVLFGRIIKNIIYPFGIVTVAYPVWIRMRFTDKTALE